MKLKPIIVLTLILLALLRCELPCRCAESHSRNVSTTIVTIENVDLDSCADCGHKKSCCAHKKLTDNSNALTVSIFSGDDFPSAVVVTVCDSSTASSNVTQRTIWNRAPPVRSVDSLYSLGQKLSV